MAFARMLTDSLHLVATASSLSLLRRERDFVFWSRLDLQNLQFLSFPNLLHFVNEAVGELL